MLDQISLLDLLQDEAQVMGVMEHVSNDITAEQSHTTQVVQPV
jgi:hypothetical protein